ncbi:MAG TPA: alpha/beta fold hydrolase, partial [Ilumatobacteraceae bacterium]
MERPIDPDLAAGEFAGAHAPDRQYAVAAGRVNIAVCEWGDSAAPPLFMLHGGFDFARTYEVFAPLIAAAGWRVVSWDQRGHGDSDHTELYSWDADLRDAVAVMSSVTQDPAPVLGHSKGGLLCLQIADAQPFRFSHLINLDGIPSRLSLPDVSEHERSRMLNKEVESWLDHRRTVSTFVRKPDTLDGLARRRGRMNPRLDPQWLRHLVTVGARHDP